MIEKTIDAWHQLISGQVPADRFEAALDDLLADEVIFYSPVVYTPQRGRDLTKMYLMAAGSTFNPSSGEGGGAKSDSTASGFRYTKKILSGNQAALEFETTLDDKYVNGMDIIECNDEGKIVEFRVMIRPLQAINTLHAKMGAMLKQMQEGSAG